MSQSLRAHSLSYIDTRSSHKLSVDEPITNKNAQSTVTRAYLTYIGGTWRNVSVVWCKNLTAHNLTISVESLEGDYHHSCKIDLKSWHFWSKKGYKLFEIDENHQIHVYWDMRSVKYNSNSPEPISDYYVALVSEQEVVLLLGDYNKKAYKRTKSRPALEEPILFSKKDLVFGKKCFATRAKFDPRKREQEILIESSTNGLRDPEMSVSIDGNIVLRIRNLQWKFRGSETIILNNVYVRVFWDVYAWLFSSPGLEHGWFVFKLGGSESDGDDYQDCSVLDNFTASDFCLFLFAWKLE